MPHLHLVRCRQGNNARSAPAVLSLETTEPRVFTLGRANDNDFQLGNTSNKGGFLSRHHARFTVDGDRCSVFDCRSVNGVYVNGTRVDPDVFVELHVGDVVGFGDFGDQTKEFEYKLELAPTEPSPTNASVALTQEIHAVVTPVKSETPLLGSTPVFHHRVNAASKDHATLPSTNTTSPTQPNNKSTSQPNTTTSPTQPNNNSSPTQPNNNSSPTQPNNNSSPTKPDELALLQKKLRMAEEKLKLYENAQLTMQDCLSCSICFELPENPIALECSHMFCSKCWANWTKTNNTGKKGRKSKRLIGECPTCRAKVYRQPVKAVPIEQTVSLLKEFGDTKEDHPEIATYSGSDPTQTAQPSTHPPRASKPSTPSPQLPKSTTSHSPPVPKSSSTLSGECTSHRIADVSGLTFAPEALTTLTRPLHDTPVFYKIVCKRSSKSDRLGLKVKRKLLNGLPFVLVTAVAPGKLGDRAEMQPNDMIISVKTHGHVVTSFHEMVDVFREALDFTVECCRLPSFPMLSATRVLGKRSIQQIDDDDDEVEIFIPKKKPPVVVDLTD